MSPVFYIVCVTFLLTGFLTYLCGILHINKNHQLDKKKNILVFVSMLSALVPMFLLGTFVYVFLQGGSSTAQVSYHRSDLWSFWVNIYFPLFGCSIVAALSSLVAFLMELDPKRYFYSFLCRCSSVLSFIPTFFVLFTTVPDA